MTGIVTILDQIQAVILQGPFLLYTAAFLIGALAVSSAAGFLRGGTRQESEDKKLGVLRRKIVEVRALIDNPTRHATIVDRQNISFSFFSLVSGGLFFAVEIGLFDNFTPWGWSGPLLIIAVAIVTSVVAAATLAIKWVWSSPFIDFEKWKAKQEQRIDARIRRAGPQREQRKFSDEEAQDLEARFDRDENMAEREAVEEEVGPAAEAATTIADLQVRRSVPEEPSADQFVTFLNSRQDVRLVLAPGIDDGRGNRPWRIGTIQRVGDAGYGFLVERVPSADSKSVSIEGDEYYFNFSNICNAESPEAGDEVFFIAVEGARLSGAHKPPAYLVCLRNKPCRAIVKTAFASGKRGFVEITDGSDNFASVLASFDRGTQESDHPLEDGDLITGSVGHNNVGLILTQGKRVT